MSVLLISTYDLGRQPFGLASAAAALHAAGISAICADLSREPLSESVVSEASLVAFFLPMHTATRLALPVIDRVRALNPAAMLCAYGLYAPLNAAILREHGLTTIIGGEFEDDLVAVAQARVTSTLGTSHVATSTSHVGTNMSHVTRGTSHVIPRVQFHVPLRESLPRLERYAWLQWGSERRVVGYTEASRGCKHRCRHCPIVPIYDGRFRIVPAGVVIEDIRQQVAAGARHVTFGDPDFFNGPRHAIAIVQRLATEFSDVTYDVTIKVEHLIAHAELLPTLKDTGCAFVTSAVESIDDEVLLRLEKGHTAADFDRAVTLCRRAGLFLTPTFVAFTPWTTLQSYVALLQTIDRLELIDHVAPIQLAIRLLIPEGSRMLELEEMRQAVGPFDRHSLTYRWVHADAAVDRLQETIAARVGRRLNDPRQGLFAEIWQTAHEALGAAPPHRQDLDLLPRAAVPYLNEPWYC